MIGRYCACGAGIRLVGGDELLNAQVLEAWQRDHLTEGHEEVTSAEANAVRMGQPRARKLHARDDDHPTWALCGGFGDHILVVEDSKVTCEHCRRRLAT